MKDLRLYILLLLFIVVGTSGAQEIKDTLRVDSLATTQTEQQAIPSDSLLLCYLSQQGIPITHNNTTKLLKSGTEKFTDLFESIRQAQHHIHLEYFNFRNDSIATAMFDLLAVKAQEGIQVRLIFDAFGNLSNTRPISKKQLKAIRKRGIEIVKFDPINFPFVNHAAHRDHRKIAVIDGKIGYTGGMNIADYYIKGLPKIGAWRDMHIRIEGSAVHNLQEIFLLFWNNETKQQIGGDEYFPEPIEKEDGKNETVAIVDRDPQVNPKQLRRIYAKAINSARRSIKLINPYFVPTSSIKKELKKAIERGVEVQIMISTKSDIAFTPEASYYVTHQLMKKGAEIYLYNSGFHHSKIMMIDHSYCTVGSTNLNSRSLRYDYETNAFVFNKETTEELIQVFEEDKKDCTIMSPEVWKKRSKWKRFVGWFAHLFTPFI